MKKTFALEKEEQIFIKHMTELSEQAYHHSKSVYSNFLSLNEQNLFYSSLKEFEHIPHSVFGGFLDAERVIVCFHGKTNISQPDITNTEYINYEDYPIKCIKVIPSNIKFAEELNHRDYLGAVLNLGINRSFIGDIILKDKEGYIFCLDTISTFIEENLIKIKHTNVKPCIIENTDFAFKREYKQITGTVASVRLDSIVSVGFNISRNSIMPYINSGKVFINGRENTSNSAVIKEGDIISVRGLGKLKYEGSCGVTKKGRISVNLLKYV